MSHAWQACQRNQILRGVIAALQLGTVLTLVALIIALIYPNSPGPLDGDATVRDEGAIGQQMTGIVPADATSSNAGEIHERNHPHSNHISCNAASMADKNMTGARGKWALVTGGAGFIGSHVAKHCARLGMNVVVIDDLSGGHVGNIAQEEHAIVFVEGDMKDVLFLRSVFDTFPRFDYVYHLAAYAAEGLSHFIRSYNYRNNLVASAELLNMAVKSGVECFVFTSSIAVYGAGQTPMTETTQPVPEDPYGIAKYAFELDLAAAKRVFGIDHVIFRPHNVYGPGQEIHDKYRNVIGIFFDQLLKGEPLTVFGDGEQVRAFTYIDDVAPIIAQAPLVPRARNQVFNLGAEQTYTVNQLAKEVIRAMDAKDVQIKHLPPRKEVFAAFSDHAKVRCYFGDRGETPLATGLMHMASWVNSNGKHVVPPAAFDSVEVLRNMPPSWNGGSMSEVDFVYHGRPSWGGGRVILGTKAEPRFKPLLEARARTAIATSASKCGSSPQAWSTNYASVVRMEDADLIIVVLVGPSLDLGELTILSLAASAGRISSSSGSAFRIFLALVDTNGRGHGQELQRRLTPTVNQSMYIWTSRNEYSGELRSTSQTDAFNTAINRYLQSSSRSPLLVVDAGTYFHPNTIGSLMDAIKSGYSYAYATLLVAPSSIDDDVDHDLSSSSDNLTASSTRFRDLACFHALVDRITSSLPKTRGCHIAPHSPTRGAPDAVPKALTRNGLIVTQKALEAIMPLARRQQKPSYEFLFSAFETVATNELGFSGGRCEDVFVMSANPPPSRPVAQSWRDGVSEFRKKDTLQLDFWALGGQVDDDSCVSALVEWVLSEYHSDGSDNAKQGRIRGPLQLVDKLRSGRDMLDLPNQGDIDERHFATQEDDFAGAQSWETSRRASAVGGGPVEGHRIPDFVCTPGQGGSGQSTGHVAWRFGISCEDECRQSEVCVSFDVPTRSSRARDYCRFFGSDTLPRLGEGGRLERVFCQKPVG